MEGIKIDLGGESYLYVKAAEQPDAFAAMNQLARRVFDVDFTLWQALGSWDFQRYQPHLLLKDGAAVANVSANRMTFARRREAGGEGEEQQFLQLGTVMTHPDYRGKGLADWLMRQVLAEWENSCDGIYLYANDDARDFYTRFGFTPMRETSSARAVPQHLPLLTQAHQLDVNDAEDRAIILEACARGNPYAALENRGNSGLVLFHALHEYSGGFYHLEVYDAVVVARVEGNTLLCAEVLGGRTPMLDNLTAPLLRADTTRVVFGFTPLFATEEERCRFSQPDTTLMVRAGCDFLQREQLLLPVLSRA